MRRFAQSRDSFERKFGAQSHNQIIVLQRFSARLYLLAVEIQSAHLGLDELHAPAQELRQGAGNLAWLAISHHEPGERGHKLMLRAFLDQYDAVLITETPPEFVGCHQTADASA
jgi:hypothetical protein